VEIVVLLQDLLGNLKVIVVAELTLNGIACAVAELAKVVAGLILIVYEVLLVVGVTDVALIGVVVTIGGLLVEVLTVVVVGLDVADVLIKPYV